MLTVAPALPMMAPVPPVMLTPGVVVVRSPKLKAFCLLLNIIQSALDKRPLAVEDAFGKFKVTVPPKDTGEPLILKSVPVVPAAIVIDELVKEELGRLPTFNVVPVSDKPVPRPISSAEPAPVVARPNRRLLAEMFCSFEYVTAWLAMVALTLPGPLAVTSPVRPVI